MGTHSISENPWRVILAAGELIVQNSAIENPCPAHQDDCAVVRFAFGRRSRSGLFVPLGENWSVSDLDFGVKLSSNSLFPGINSEPLIILFWPIRVFTH